MDQGSVDEGSKASTCASAGAKIAIHETGQQDAVCEDDQNEIEIDSRISYSSGFEGERRILLERYVPIRGGGGAKLLNDFSFRIFLMNVVSLFPKYFRISMELGQMNQKLNHVNKNLKIIGPRAIQIDQVAQVWKDSIGKSSKDT